MNIHAILCCLVKSLNCVVYEYILIKRVTEEVKRMLTVVNINKVFTQSLTLILLCFIEAARTLLLNNINSYSKSINSSNSDNSDSSDNINEDMTFILHTTMNSNYKIINELCSTIFKILIRISLILTSALKMFINENRK